MEERLYELEKRFLHVERDLIRENKFSIAKRELGKIIHDAKIKNLSEAVNRARELLRSCNSKERELSKKIDENNNHNDDAYFGFVKKESELMAKFPGSGEIVQTPLGPIRKLTKTEMEARKKFSDSLEYIEPLANKRKINIEEAFPEIHQVQIEEEQIRKIILDLNTKFERVQIAEISKICQIDDDLFIIKTIEEMIQNKEITAQYLSNTKSVVFNRSPIIHSDSSPEKRSIQIGSLSEINWETPRRACSNCGKEVVSESQLICEGCGAYLKKNKEN